MGKSTISMAMFNSKPLVYQRVNHRSTWAMASVAMLNHWDWNSLLNIQISRLNLTEAMLGFIVLLVEHVWNPIGRKATFRQKGETLSRWSSNAPGGKSLIHIHQSSTKLAMKNNEDCQHVEVKWQTAAKPDFFFISQFLNKTNPPTFALHIPVYSNQHKMVGSTPILSMHHCLSSRSFLL